MLKKFRQRNWWMVLGLIVTAFILGAFTNYGVPLSMAGLFSIIGLLIIGLLVAGVVLLVDNIPNTVRNWLSFAAVAASVLLVMTLITPLSEWILGLLGV